MYHNVDHAFISRGTLRILAPTSSICEPESRNHVQNSSKLAKQSRPHVGGWQRNNIFLCDNDGHEYDNAIEFMNRKAAEAEAEAETTEASVCLRLCPDYIHVSDCARLTLNFRHRHQQLQAEARRKREVLQVHSPHRFFDHTTHCLHAL